MKFDNQTYRISGGEKLGNLLLIIGLAGLVLSAVGLVVDSRQFLFSYLVSFAFWVSIGLGALFFVMVHHLAGAVWSVMLRRIMENVMITLPILFVFFIPIALGMGSLYEWTDGNVVATDEILRQRTAYLNSGFFLGRTTIYFAVWFVLAICCIGLTIRQDASRSDEMTAKFRKISAPGIVLFAFTLTFAAWDWLMSLEARWYSTIYGVYFFAGSSIAILALIILISLYLRRKQVLTTQITAEHYHDLSKLMFAFVIFWGYMAFAQYLLIWYANVPEETIWFQHRWVGSWKAMTLLLVFGQFALPFAFLIPRLSKRRFWTVGVAAGWLLLMHWADMYWLVMPSLHKEGVSLSWMDLTTLAGIGGVYLGLTWKRLCAQPLVPVNDPRLQDSIEFVNR